jgi:hypothetical protein
MEWILAAALMLAASHRPDTVPASLDVEILLEYLRGDFDADQMMAMQTFANQSDAPDAIPRLLHEMQESAPALDNNVGLVLEMILQAHPDAKCDLEPLRECIRRHIWNSQQKCGMALARLLARGDGAGKVQDIARDLIPLLASQRPRVFETAQRGLQGLTGQRLGDSPEPWLQWYRETFGQPLDMTGAVYEDLLVIHPVRATPDDRSGARYEVEGETLSLKELKNLLGVRKAAADQRGLHLGVSIQVPQDVVNRFLESDHPEKEVPEVAAALDAVHAVHLREAVVSPESDAFRAPWKPAAAGTP